jgi:hypothetical protein
MKAGVKEGAVEVAVLDEGIARLFDVKNSEAGGLLMVDVRAKAASELSNFGTVLLAELEKRDIRIPPAVQLHSLEEGRVLVLGDHPAARQIADLVNEDIYLLKRFKEVEVFHVLLRRAELRLAKLPMTCQHFNLGLTSMGCIAFFTEG